MKWVFVIEKAIQVLRTEKGNMDYKLIKLM